MLNQVVSKTLTRPGRPGLPLFILLPHVTTLELRDFVPNWMSKESLGAVEISLHV